MPEEGDRINDAMAPNSLDDVEEAEWSEAQPLRTLSTRSDEGDVEDFARTNDLYDRLELLRKAAHLREHDGIPKDVPGVTSGEIEALHNEATHKWRQPRLLYFTIFVCSLGAIEQGWAQTGMNGANLYLPGALGLQADGTTDGSFLLGLINCAMYLSNSFIGCWLSEPLNIALGRRGAIFWGNVFCAVGNLGSALVPSARSSVPLLVGFRLILGIGLGINASTVSVFAAESAPAYIRGGLAVSWQMFTAFGILLGFVANLAFYNFDDGLIWRLQLAAPAIPTVPLLALIYLCPESASWYVKRSRCDLAFASLSRLRHTELQAAVELYSIAKRSRHVPSSTGVWSSIKKLSSLPTIPRNRHALLASYTVMISQQLCGINIIAFYSSTIFSSSGSIIAGLWASVVFGLVNFLGAFPAIWTMDSFGRRRLLLWTLPAMGLTMALAAISFSIPSGAGSLQFVVLAALIYVFCALYSPGMGPVPCAYSAEVYPLEVREIGMSLAISTASSWGTILALTVPPLLENIGEQGVFALYALLNLVSWTLCWLFVRETKGVKLEEMDSIFESSSLSFIRERWSEGLGGWRAGIKHRKGYGELQQHDTDGP